MFQIPLRNRYKLFFQFSGPKENGPKNWFCPILNEGNTLTHKIDIYGLLKTPAEFCYGRGARDPLWVPMKTSRRYHHFTHVQQKPKSYEVQLLRHEVRRTKFSVILGHFSPF